MRRSKRTEVEPIVAAADERATTEDVSGAPADPDESAQPTAPVVGAPTHESEMTAEDLQAWMDLPRPSLADSLTEAGVEDLEGAVEAASAAELDGRDVGEALVAGGHLSEHQWVAALSFRFDLPVAAVDNHAAEPDAVAKVPEDLARRHNVLPFKVEQNRVYLATSDPLDATAIGELANQCGAIGLLVAAAPAIGRSLDRTYDALAKADAAIAAFGLMDDTSEFEAGTARAVVDENSPVVQVVTQIITQGVRKRASDIHIEALERAVRVRYRIDGALTEAIQLPANMSSPIASRIKVLADLNIVER
ncbi:MAG: hypothetical protein KDB24_17495, partial [Microthrixaceae bacterium]|nr:hypothetical protein [Microthrixaceae bacterium]